MSVHALTVPSAPRRSGKAPLSVVPNRAAEFDGTLDLLGRDHTVTLVNGERVAYADFDYAATAPCLAAVHTAVTEALGEYASAHRGAGALSTRTTDRYEQARTTVADFLGCRADDTVVFTRNTTDAANLLAHALPPDTPTVVFDSEHHATLLPWRRPIRLPIPDSPAAAVRSVDAALRELRRHDDRTPILVAVTGASNVTGELWPVGDIARVAHRYDARVFLDAAQLAPHREVDIDRLDVDYVAISGHKLYAPFGCGALAGRADWLDAAPPYLAGGGASRYVGTATHDVRWATGPARHEAGTPNVIGAVALAAACRALAAAGVDRIAAEEQALLARLRTGLSRIPGVRELTGFGREHPRVGIVAFVVDGVAADTVARRLADEYGIGVRAGLFCAHPFTRRLLGETAERRASQPAAATGSAVRASLGLGTSLRDVDRLIAAVEAIAERR